MVSFIFRGLVDINQVWDKLDFSVLKSCRIFVNSKTFSFHSIVGVNDWFYLDVAFFTLLSILIQNSHRISNTFDSFMYGIFRWVFFIEYQFQNQFLKSNCLDKNRSLRTPQHITIWNLVLNKCEVQRFKVLIV